MTDRHNPDLTDPIKLAMHAATTIKAAQPVQWTCGHLATEMCAECYIKLAQHAHRVAVALDEALAVLRELRNSCEAKYHPEIDAVIARAVAAHPVLVPDDEEVKS